MSRCVAETCGCGCGCGCGCPHAEGGVHTCRGRLPYRAGRASRALAPSVGMGLGATLNPAGCVEVKRPCRRLTPPQRLLRWGVSDRPGRTELAKPRSSYVKGPFAVAAAKARPAVANTCAIPVPTPCQRMRPHLFQPMCTHVIRLAACVFPHMRPHMRPRMRPHYLAMQVPGWRGYGATEFWYIVLSLTAKQLLAWINYGGTKALAP
eukprot:364868-Chlamydomonas_euryale.AAC.14